MAWYITLCTNTATFPTSPTTWKAFWDKGNAGKIGAESLLTSSFLLETTAATFFGGNKILDTREGIESVLGKLAEMIPNVQLWYRDEGQFQQALQSGEVPMGQYFHDVTTLAAKNGFPVRSTFPSEGGVVQYGSWLVAKSVTAVEESQEFINFTCDPRIQALISRQVGTAPIVDRKKTDLTDAEFAAVSSDIPPILPRYDVYLDHGDWLSQRWSTMISG
jgi:putative spermidine/putrescine transport system substrate-binding protein